MGLRDHKTDQQTDQPTDGFNRFRGALVRILKLHAMIVQWEQRYEKNYKKHTHSKTQEKGTRKGCTQKDMGRYAQNGTIWFIDVGRPSVHIEKKGKKINKKKSQNQNEMRPSHSCYH